MSGEGNGVKVEELSPSEVNTFYECRRKWFFRKSGRTGIVVDTEAMEFGRLVHDIISNYFVRISPNPTATEIEETLETLFKEQQDLVPRRYRRKYFEILGNLKDFEVQRLRTWKQFKPDLVEVKVEAKPFKDLPKLVGVVDFYDATDGVLLDWKTGASDEDSYLRQASIYKLMLREKGYPVNRVLFLSLSTGRALTIPNVTEGWVYRVLRSVVDALEAENFFPNPGPRCRGCEYVLDCQLSGGCLWR